MNYFIEYTNLNYICTCFILAGRIKIALVRVLWGGCCPLTLGVSHKQLLHSGTPLSTVGSFCSVCSHCFLCSSRAKVLKSSWESWLLHFFQLFHYAEDIINILKKKHGKEGNMNGRIQLYMYQELPFLPQMAFKHSYSQKTLGNYTQETRRRWKLIMGLLCQLEDQVWVWVFFKCAYVSQNRNCANFCDCSKSKSDQ